MEESCLSRARAPLSMMLVQSFATGMMVLSKLVLSRGMFIFALLFYRNAIGAATVAPLAYYKERSMWKKLTKKLALWIFLNALSGLIMAMGLYYYGLRDTTPAYSTDFLNTIPIATFILSVLLREEPLRWGTWGGKAKVFGALCCVAGAMIISLYRGHRIHLWPSVVKPNSQMVTGARATHWGRGTALMVGCVASYAVWFVIQSKLLRKYPAMYMVTALTCIAACAQSAVLGLVIDRRWSVWRLGWNLELVTIVYSGVLNTAVTFVLIAWAISQRGPTYPPMFNALSLVFITIIESLFMRQDLTVGSLLGMIFIASGIYAFLWGIKMGAPKNQVPAPAAAVGAADAVVNPEPEGPEVDGTRPNIQGGRQQQQNGHVPPESVPPV